MPGKTTKAKPTKKSPSRLDRVIKKFNLARPRNQFIAVFLMVGVLGGGYFTYQSFAETLLYRWVPSNLKCVNSPYCGPSVNTSKGNIPILTAANGSTIHTKNAYYFIANQYYKICITADGTGTIDFGRDFGFQSYLFVNPSALVIDISSSSGAKQFCTYGKPSISQSRYVDMKVVKGPGVNIYNIEIFRDLPPPTLPTSPSPSK
jgi:hypothetical protein